MVFADLIFLVNVQEHATLSAEASVETGVKVHTTGDVADKALVAVVHRFEGILGEHFRSSIALLRRLLRTKLDDPINQESASN
jgi:hypothetical protein